MFSKDEMIKEILSNPYTASFVRKNNIQNDYLKNHLSSFIDCLDSLKICENCKGLDACKQAKKGEYVTLNCDGTIYNEVTYCKLYLEKKRKEKRLSYFVRCDIPEAYENLTLDKVEPVDDNISNLMLECYDILDEKRYKGLYIYGDLGVGKTYMCMALANSLANKQKKVAFVKVNFFVNEMRKLISINNEEYDKTLKSLKTVDYLILDDIGSESVSAYSRDDLLFNILDYRMEYKLTTIFTSNLSKDALLKHYTYDVKDNSSIIRAKRLYERVDILSDDFVLEGKNKRRT